LTLYILSFVFTSFCISVPFDASENTSVQECATDMRGPDKYIS